MASAAVESRARTPADAAAEFAAEVLREDGSMEEDTPLLLGKPAALFSGGKLGIDTLFGQAAEVAGHLVVHWVAPSTKVSRKAKELNGGGSLCSLDPEVLGHPRVAAALDRCARLRAGADSFEELCQREPSYAQRREELQRCFFQVVRACSVYVLSHRPSNPDDAGQPPLDLGGDLGWAAQLYVNRFKPLGEEDGQLCQLFLFDNSDEGNPEHLQDASTRQRWSYWQVPNSRNGLAEGRWVPFGTAVPVLQRTTAAAWKSAAQPPAPSGFYAGLGATDVPWACSGHEEALSRLYAQRPESRVPVPAAGRRSEGGKGRKGKGKMDGEEVDV